MVRTNWWVWQVAERQHESKTRLLDATLKVVRAKGYTATRIEDVCAEAGVTKGSFFHHFKSKEDLALAAASHWQAYAAQVFSAAPYRELSDPLDRLIGYVEFRKSILTGELPDFTCFAGTIIQEAYRTHPEVSAACEISLRQSVETLAVDVHAAMLKYRVRGEWTAESLAQHIQVVIQGSFILAKAKGNAAVAAESLDHLQRYIELLFRGARARRTQPPDVAKPVRWARPGN